MWILILSMAFGSGGAAIHSVEFNTRESCYHAGNLWLKEAAKEKIGSIKTAICVESGG